MSTRQQTELIVRPRQLTQEEAVQELAKIPVGFRVEDPFLVLEKGPRGWSFKQPVKVHMDKVLAVRERGLVSYIVQACAPERPKLIPFIFDNQSLVRLARHFLRHCSGSLTSLYSYTDTVSRYSQFLGHSPDMIISDVKAGGNIQDPIKVQNHVGFLEDYLANLQDNGLSVGRVHGVIKQIRSFYRANSVEIRLAEPLSRRVTYKDRAPQPEELLKVLDVADLRERVIVSMLALGGFREATLAKLEYRHVREDLEKARTPIHIHVEAQLTKGKYHDYDAFLGAEAAEYLRLYLDKRQLGSPEPGSDRRPPEKLEDKSPLIRDKTVHRVRPIGPKQIRKLVHNLFAEAGLLKPAEGRMYELRVHTLRKYFKTQLLALGIQSDYVDYWMGHTVDAYNDIQSLGVEKLREVYAASNLSIRPKTRTSKIELYKAIIRANGDDPERILTREAFTAPARTYQGPEELQNQYEQILARTVRELVQREAVKT